jgi:hypothetical protein
MDSLHLAQRHWGDIDLNEQHATTTGQRSAKTLAKEILKVKKVSFQTLVLIPSGHFLELSHQCPYQ